MNPIPKAAVQALGKGRAAVTIGPLVTMEVESAGSYFAIGDTVHLPDSNHDGVVDRYEGHVKTNFSVRPGLWELPEQAFTLRITGNKGMLTELSVGAADEVYRMDFPAGGLHWVRAELWGTVRGARTLIAFTNAIYFNEGRTEA